MRYIIYGAGAIGSILGGHLCRSGADVVLVGSQAHVRAIRRRGLTLRLPEETLSIAIPAVTRAVQLAPFRPGDVVLLCAKTHQTLRCLSQLRAACAPPTLPVFCCQNSFLNEPQATLFFDRVYGVAVMVDGIFLEPGEAVHPTGRRHGHLELGRYPRGLDPLARRVARDLQQAGFSVRPTADVMRSKRAKFVLNMANAVIAITNDPDRMAPVVTILRREAERVLRASGLSCEPFAAFRRRASQASGELRLPPDASAAGLIADSTWQSLYRRKGSVETPFFNGVIVHLGRALGISTPANAIVAEVVGMMARRKQQPGRYTVAQVLARIAARRGADKAAKKAARVR